MSQQNDVGHIDPRCSTIDYHGWITDDISIVINKKIVYISVDGKYSSIPLDALKLIAEHIKQRNL